MSAGHKLGLSHSLTTKPVCGRDNWYRQGHGNARISRDPALNVAHLLADTLNDG
jgi:hypothetical protein